MSEIRNWKVTSNSFRKPDTTIQGETLEGAIRESLSRLASEAMPSGGRWKPHHASAEWYPSILRGKGGVELIIDAKYQPTGKNESGQFVLWIAAPRSDMPNPVKFMF